MKKIIILSLTIVCLIACKRKQTLLDETTLNPKLAKYPAHCYNELQDADEFGLNCGGSCQPCNYPTPSCTVTLNSLRINSSAYSTVGTSCSATSGSEFTFSGTYSGGTYDIKIGNSTPDLSVTYNIISGSVLNSNEAEVTINDGSLGNMVLSGGTVYITQIAGNYQITVCNGTAYSFVTTTNYSIKAKVTCP